MPPAEKPQPVSRSTRSVDAALIAMIVAVALLLLAGALGLL